MKAALQLFLLAFGLFLFGTLLPSCVPTAPQSDPFSLQAQAENALNVAHAQMTATAQAEIMQAEQEILQQAQTQAADSQRATATALVFDGMQTQAAATLTQAARETAQAVHGTETAIALQKLQAGATATQSAMETLQVIEATSTQHAADLAALTLAIILDPRRMFSPATVITAKSQAVTAPALAPDPRLQWLTTQNAQWVEFVRAVVGGYHPPYPPTDARVSPNLLPSPSLEPPTETENHLPRVVSWRMLEEWHGGGLPLGLGKSGLLLADPENNPHLLIAGTSGSGKTRYALRPVIAGALADGWQVVIFDRSGLDFLPFQNHPNARLVLLPEPIAAIRHLNALFGEVQRRFAVLREKGISTWGRLPDADPRIMVVFDEFSNLADSLPNAEREDLWRGARMVAAEGRKAGVHLVLALQDPTHKSLDLRIRRNCTPLAFRVLDDAASRVVLNTSGADALPPRQFLTVLNAQLHRGVAFSPADGEITSFLEHRSVSPLPHPAWLDNTLPSAKESDAPIGVDMSLVERIRPIWRPDVSLSEIAQALGMQPGGTHYYKLRAALDYLADAHQ